MFLFTITSYFSLSANHFTDDSLKILYCFQKADSFCQIDLDSAYFYLDIAIDIANDINDCNTLVKALIAKANCASYHIQMDKVSYYLKQAENIHYSLFGDTKCQSYSLLTEIKKLWADYYYELGDFDLSLRNLHLIENEIFKDRDLNTDDIKTLKFNTLYIAANYFKKDNYDAAIENYYQSTYYEKLLAEKTNRTPDFSYIYKYLAPAYQAKGEPDSARIFYSKYLDRLDSLSEAEKDKKKRKGSYIVTYHDLSSLFRSQHLLDSAEWALKKSMTYHLPSDPFLAKTYYQLGMTLLDKKVYREAANYFYLSIQVQEKNTGKRKSYQIARSYLGWGDVYAEQLLWKEALQYYQLAINNLVDEFNSNNIFVNPELVMINSQKDLLTALDKKSIATYRYYQKHPKQSQYLEVSWKTVLLAIELIDSIRIDYASDEDKKFLLEKSYSIFAFAIELAYLKGEHFFEKAFELSEKSKAVLLFEAIRAAKVEDNLQGHPDSLEKMHQIRHALNKNKILISEEKVFSRLQQLTNKQIQLKRQYNVLIADLEHQNPDYFRLKYSLDIIPVSIIKEVVLATNQAMVEYFICDHGAYIFVADLSLDHVIMKKTSWNVDWSRMATTLKDDILAQNNAAYIQKARALYDHLVKPVLAVTNAEHLIIVPDGELWNVPFDALLTCDISENEQRNFKKFPYLVIEKSISYGFSATLQLEMSQQKNTGGGKLQAYAPTYRKINAPIAARNQLDTLIFNIEEAKAITRLSGGEFFIGPDATKNHSRQSFSQANFLHISGHAKANHQNPNFSFIAFSNTGDTLLEPYLLYAHEIYNESLPLEMVVLSACETGTGPVWKGEGVISLARAFAYSGAQNIVTTLWSVDDEASKIIMVDFYNNLKNGQSKNDALRNAKRSYIQNAPNQKKAHPLYWAAFTPIGDMGPVELNTFPWAIMLLGTPLIAVLVIWFFYRKKRV